MDAQVAPLLERIDARERERDAAPEGRSASPRTVAGWILTHPDTLPER
ncbi:hypothetical protein [Streptomyces sp. NPDC005989]